MTHSTITIGIDLAKRSFAVCTQDHSGHILARQELRRSAFAQWLAQLPAGTIVAMEACSSAHHWARRSLQYGLQPKLMAAQFVKPFRKAQNSKNDRNDAEAIATAARQGNMRFVSIKTEEQQARLSWHRVREGYKSQALCISNRLRGLLAEFGIAIAQGDSALRKALGDSDIRDTLPPILLQALDHLSDHWSQVRECLHECDRHIAAHAAQDQRCQRVQQITGVGVLTADALVAHIGDGRDFHNGRQLAAWLGLVPTQHSTGGKAKLGHISRQGDSYLRTLLIQGARSSYQRAMNMEPSKASAEQQWIRQLAARMPFGKLLVAIANKHARQLWAMLRRGQDYDREAWRKHPMNQAASVAQMVV